MQVINSIHDMKTWRAKQNNSSLGFVPTMGALHKGHLSLVERSLKDNDKTMASVFVNPTQFNNPNDLKNYPVQTKQDLQTLREQGVDAVFLPQKEELYSDNYRYQVKESEISSLLCGRSRPGHFEGVLTVVMRLFQITKPHKAYFGEKDFQQLKLIQGMVEAFFLDVQIVSCPTVRESDGLAMSSRNALLSPESREKAPRFYQTLKQASSVKEATQKLQEQSFQVDYVEEHWGQRFGAVFLGNVRLIDHVEL